MPAGTRLEQDITLQIMVGRAKKRSEPEQGPAAAKPRKDNLPTRLGLCQNYGQSRAMSG